MKILKHGLIAGIFMTTPAVFGTDTSVVGFGSATTVPLKKDAAQSTEAAVAASASGTGITDNAKKTKDSNKAGQMLNTVVGAANLAMAANCYSQCGHGGGGCCPMAPVFMLMGLQNMAQAGSQGKTSGQAGGTYGLTDTGLGTTGYDPNAVLESDPEIKKGLDFVEAMTNADPKNGFSYDPKTNSITTATGKVVTGKDVSSPSAMEAAGLSKGIIDGVMAMEKSIEAKAKKKVDKLLNIAVNGEEGGGGGGSSASSSGSGDANAGYAGSGAGSGLGVDRDPAQVAGMQKNYNGEPIGVAGDSIFKMMTRRYKTKENQNTFLDDSELLQK